VKTFNDQYRGKRVLVTGHTGFKGSWLVTWLTQMGAIVKGYALEPDTIPNHIDLLKIDIDSECNDITDLDKLKNAVGGFRPEMVFHLAAQSLVRKSYRSPVETYSSNVMGTLHLLEACKETSSVKAVVIVTTDKVYQNKEEHIAYKETDRLGGHDMYSSSKACAEILTSSYVNSFLADGEMKIATARGGNVIGGGDWCQDRIIPDIIRAYSNTRKLEIRSPQSVRPWQHVLDCLSGYLTLGAQLLVGNKTGAWNFGPSGNKFITVGEVVQKAKSHFPGLEFDLANADLHEAKLLMLDSSEANDLLNWNPILSEAETFQFTFDWYSSFYNNNKIDTHNQIEQYVKLAEQRKATWVK